MRCAGRIGRVESRLPFQAACPASTAPAVDKTVGCRRSCRGMASAPAAAPGVDIGGNSQMQLDAAFAARLAEEERMAALGAGVRRSAIRPLLPAPVSCLFRSACYNWSAGAFVEMLTDRAQQL